MFCATNSSAGNTNVSQALSIQLAIAADSFCVGCDSPERLCTIQDSGAFDISFAMEGKHKEGELHLKQRIANLEEDV